MKPLLLKCLEEVELTFYLRSHKHTRLSKGYNTYLDIYYICRSPFCEGDSQIDEICLWQNVLNVVNGTTKCLKICSLVFTNESVNWQCMICYNTILRLKKKKKDFLFL